ncbi:unnamed protein product [Protopolystoma xenopodis]|uniref:Uncharacterized protein n=1 Tax=Protopolystoma xenopodis TaxID=117903 RepID=A0A3S5BX53_9PLAT|nr:unnamed protein product [Protopolystoma xenopodis]
MSLIYNHSCRAPRSEIVIFPVLTSFRNSGSSNGRVGQTGRVIFPFSLQLCLLVSSAAFALCPLPSSLLFYRLYRWSKLDSPVAAPFTKSPARQNNRVHIL